jgi:hypothetical protein
LTISKTRITGHEGQFELIQIKKNESNFILIIFFNKTQPLFYLGSIELHVDSSF